MINLPWAVVRSGTQSHWNWVGIDKACSTEVDCWATVDRTSAEMGVSKSSTTGLVWEAKSSALSGRYGAQLCRGCSVMSSASAWTHCQCNILTNDQLTLSSHEPSKMVALQPGWNRLRSIYLTGLAGTHLHPREPTLQSDCHRSEMPHWLHVICCDLHLWRIWCMSWVERMAADGMTEFDTARQVVAGANRGIHPLDVDREWKTILKVLKDSEHETCAQEPADKHLCHHTVFHSCHWNHIQMMHERLVLSLVL